MIDSARVISRVIWFVFLFFINPAFSGVSGEGGSSDVCDISIEVGECGPYEESSEFFQVFYKGYTLKLNGEWSPADIIVAESEVLHLVFESDEAEAGLVVSVHRPLFSEAEGGGLEDQRFFDINRRVAQERPCSFVGKAMFCNWFGPGDLRMFFDDRWVGALSAEYSPQGGRPDYTRLMLFPESGYSHLDSRVIGEGVDCSDFQVSYSPGAAEEFERDAVSEIIESFLSNGSVSRQESEAARF